MNKGFLKIVDAVKIEDAALIVKADEVCMLHVDGDDDTRKYVLTILFKNGVIIKRELDWDYPSLQKHEIASMIGCNIWGKVDGYDTKGL